MTFLLRSFVDFSRKYFQESLKEIQAEFETTSKNLLSESPEKKSYWPQSEREEEDDRRFKGSMYK